MTAPQAQRTPTDWNAKRAEFVIHALRGHAKMGLGTSRTVSHVHAEDAASFVRHYDALVAALRAVDALTRGCLLGATKLCNDQQADTVDRAILAVRAALAAASEGQS